MAAATTATTGQLRRQLGRMAVEMATFLYVPGTVTVDNYYSGEVRSVDGGGPVFGAPVYYDVIRYGGVGTRRDVRVAIDRVIWQEVPERQEDVRNVEAVTVVAGYRQTDPRRVSAPLLPENVSALYRRLAVRVDEVLSEQSASHGRWVARSLRTHDKTPFGERGVQNTVDRARLAWRAAIGALQDDLGLWVQEQADVARLFAATGGSTAPVARVRVQEGPSRLITLDDEEL